MKGFARQTMPLLPLRGLLVYPTMVLHLDVGREKSIKALEKAMAEENLIFLSSQRDVHLEDPLPDDIYQVGTVAKIRQMLKLPNGTIRVLIEGLRRARVLNFIQTLEFFEVEYEDLGDELSDDSQEVEALIRSVMEQFEKYAKLSKKVSSETFATVSDIEQPGRLADVIAANLTLKVKEKQEILEILSVKERLQSLLNLLSDESSVLELERQISQRVKKQMEKSQKEYYLREQMKAIQKELGDKDGRAADVEDVRQRIGDRELPDFVVEKIEKELSRLEKMPPSSAEGSIVLTYLDWLLDLPWKSETQDSHDLARAEKILEEEHFGLEKAKERILEYLAVQKRVQHLRGPILCLVGPPGVGKTSLARSVANALGRHFVRISLGGVRDEAEIRGHRRTYVGAMPGRIIQGMKEAKSVNPVFLLDEIDKMSSDFRGNPAAALLEVLDPSQNATYSDHYVELPYDLSKVLFITTANALHNIPRPLLDRMETLYISGYTELEKQQIARRHLLPKQMREHGLEEGQLVIDDEILLSAIRSYTREAGVRGLERQMAALCRKATKILVTDENQQSVTVTPDNLKDFLGVPRYRFGLAQEEDQVGVVTGLAWTEAGGDTLSVEVSIFSGKGHLTLTGHLGEVMKESAQAAVSYIRSHAAKWGIDPEEFSRVDIHVHVPEGAIPKDGPSAGITIATALVSALTQKPVSREVAMTGEITLRGRVLPIGGLKEKVLSAHRAGIKKVFFPKENERDMEEIPESVLADIQMTPVGQLEQVLREAILFTAEEGKSDPLFPLLEESQPPGSDMPV